MNGSSIFQGNLYQRQQEMKEKIQKKKAERKRFGKPGKSTLSIFKSPEEKKVFRDAQRAARNKILADERNQKFFELLGLTKSATQMAALTVKDVFIPLIVSRLVDEGLLPRHLLGNALEVLNVRH